MSSKIFSGRLFFVLMIIFLAGLPSENVSAQVDPDATEKTKALYYNLKKFQKSSKFLFGQEFFNSFRFNSGSVQGDETYSDSKAVTGAHPAMLGSDFHYYLEKASAERGYHTDAVRWAYAQGYVITFDWHLSARGTSSYEYSDASEDLAGNIVHDLNGDRDWYYGELDKIITIINEDLVAGEDTIPIIFRPLHEMNGNWFWWGSAALSAAEYKTLYQLTVDYIRTRTKSVLFCWSPNTTFNLDRYPGDDYVDVIGVDGYELTVASLRTQLGAVVDAASERGKVAALTETGYRNDPGTTTGDNARAAYWKNIILPGIKDDPAGKAQQVAWVLTWINVSWGVPYVPHAGSSATAKSDFQEFKNSEAVVFGDEIPIDMYVMDTTATIGGEIVIPDTTAITAASQMLPGEQKSVLEIFPVPSGGELTILLNDFRKPSRIIIYDTKGILVTEFITSDDEITLNTSGVLKSGIYMIRASDQNKSVGRKLLIK